MELYPYQPQSNVPNNSIQAICRCSTKNRAVLRPFSIISASLLCAMDTAPIRQRLHAGCKWRIAVQGITFTSSPFLIRVPPVTTTGSPGLIPFRMLIALPRVSPISTIRSLATFFSPCLDTTNTANPSACSLERTTALSGTTVVGRSSFTAPSVNVAIIPGFSRSSRLGIVTSTENTRLFGSAEGEMDVMGPRNSSGRGDVVTLCAAPSVAKPTLVSGTPNTALTRWVSARTKAWVPLPTSAPISTLRDNTQPFSGERNEVSLSPVLACCQADLALSTEAAPASSAALAPSYCTLV